MSDRYWRDDAACLGQELLFWDPHRFDEAKRVCRTCPVIAECLADCDAAERSYDVLHLADMVFGGETPQERSARRWPTRRNRVGTFSRDGRVA